jgi:diguanylate cyclase (GGDEF)-like protein
LSADDLPIGAAIVGVADAFVSMTTELPYRARRTYDDALNELHLGASMQFHPAVIAAAEQLAVTGRLSQHALPRTRAPASTHFAPDGRATHTTSPPVAGLEFGRLGDLRALGLMIELAGITSLIPELPAFLQHVATLLGHRLGLENVMVMLRDKDERGLTVAAQSGKVGWATVGESLPFGDNPWSEVYRTGRHRSLPNLAGAGFGLGGDVGSALIVPLVVHDETIGLLFVAAARSGAFTSGDTAVLMAVAGQVASAIHVAQVHDAIKSAALTDGLTGLTNHRAFYQALEVATRDQQPIGVLLFDVVGLKEVNDTSSHLDGDLLLRTVARTIRTIVRPSDVVARYGGDEFAVILHGPIAETAAFDVGDRVNHALQYAVTDLGLPPATLRFGVAISPVDGITPNELVLAADRRMYHGDGTPGTIEPEHNGHAAADRVSAALEFSPIDPVGDHSPL